MRIILAVLLLCTMGSLTSCASEKVSEFKVKVAEAAKVAVEKELNKAFEGVEISNYECSSEAEKIAVKVYSEVAKVLKVSEEKSEKSLLSPICLLVGEKLLPDLLRGSAGDDYLCMRAIGADGLKKVAGDLCKSLKM